MAANTWFTFAFRGIKPGPLRAQLVAKAREHLKEKMVTYVLIDLDGDAHEIYGYDVRDYEFKGRSQAEAAVALLDFLNECRPSFNGNDNYEEWEDHETDFDWRSLFTPNGRMWLMEMREDREPRTVPELPVPLATKPTRSC